MKTITLLLSQLCNLQCPYCFAGEKLQESGHMSMSNFYKAMRFICSDNDPVNVRLAGGEPTLHPNIHKIMIAIARRPNVMLSLLTNGTFDSSMLESFKRIGADRLSFLINVNDCAVMGKKKYEQMCKNIETLSGNGFNVTLGINFYSLKQPYKYIVDLASRYQCRMRWSVTHPIGGLHEYVTPKLFKPIAATIQLFLKQCREQRIPVYGDCSVPLCIFKGDDLLAASLGNLSTFCTNPIVVDKDLRVSLCYGASAKPISKFKSLSDLFEYFESLEVKRNNFWLTDCRTCFYKDYDQCGGGCPYHKQQANDLQCSSFEELDVGWKYHFVSRFRAYPEARQQYVISDGMVWYSVGSLEYEIFKAIESGKEGSLRSIFYKVRKKQGVLKEDFLDLIKEFCSKGIVNVWRD